MLIKIRSFSCTDSVFSGSVTKKGETNAGRTACLLRIIHLFGLATGPLVERVRPARTVDGGLNPRLSGAALKTGTKFAANSWRPECGAMDPCQRRKPPEAVAKGQRLQGSVAR